MKHEHAVQVASRMVSIQRDYEHLKGNLVLSLQELFNFNQFDLNTFCSDFSPHPQSKLLTASARKFCDQYGIWLPNAEHYISCALFLYPKAGFERMETMLKNLAIGYYLNDIMGRDLFKYLPARKREKYASMIERMSKVSSPFNAGENLEAVELANLEMLREVELHSTTTWFKTFLPCFSRYIEVTHRDCSCVKLGGIISVNEYMDMRYCTSGMGHIVLFIEYAEGDFLDWDWLRALGISDVLENVHKSSALIGALMNDFFSLEKEVMDNNADSNLIMASALNSPGDSLMDVIYRCAEMIRSLLNDYLEGMEQIRHCIEPLHDAQAALVQRHLAGLDRCVQASWLWQVYTQRYKRPGSIWKETSLS